MNEGDAVAHCGIQAERNKFLLKCQKIMSSVNRYDLAVDPRSSRTILSRYGSAPISCYCEKHSSCARRENLIAKNASSRKSIINPIEGTGWSSTGRKWRNKRMDNSMFEICHNATSSNSPFFITWTARR